MAPERWSDDDRVVDVLRAGRLLFLGVGTPHGPHVTPIAFDVEDDRLWIVVPRDSAKYRAVRADDRVGGLVRGTDHDVVLGGIATVVDPLRARGVSPDTLLDLPFAATGYLSRNRRHVTGVLRDAASPTLPLSRAALRIDITRVALLRGDRLVAAWGHWGPGSRLLHGDLEPETPRLRGVPQRLHRFLDRDAAFAALGWRGPAGPIVLPARRQATGRIRTSAAALELCGALPAGRASLTVESSRHRLDSKRGLLLVGDARVRGKGEVAEVSIRQQRLTWWHGSDTGTISG